MNKFLAGMLLAALAGGTAYAQQDEPLDPMQDSAQEQTSEYGEEVGEWTERDPMSEREPTQSTMDDPTMSETQPEEATTSGEDSQDAELYGQESDTQQHELSDMSADEIKGMTIVSDTGEEIGTIDRVGQVRAVTVDIGGFLGVGAKTVAIPLSELEVTSDGNLKTSLTRESLEARQELDEQAFTDEGGEESTSY